MLTDDKSSKGPVRAAEVERYAFKIFVEGMKRLDSWEPDVDEESIDHTELAIILLANTAVAAARIFASVSERYGKDPYS